MKKEFEFNRRELLIAQEKLEKQEIIIKNLRQEISNYKKKNSEMQ